MDSLSRMETLNLLEPIISAEAIQSRIHELAHSISKHYEQDELHIVGVLKGAFVFVADLIRALSIPCYVHFVQTSSYGNQTQSSGNVNISNLPQLENKQVLIVDDIHDSGLTLEQLLIALGKQKPKSLEICTLLRKEKYQKSPVHIRFNGFTIPDDFVVGYGLDYAERYRELPYIARLSLIS
ncbi:hypoxanthine phosphoribosyltransferase [Deltaproteobacteria bacterium TL4]